MNWTADLVRQAYAAGGDGVSDAAQGAARVSLWDGLAVMAAAPALEPATRPFHDLALAAGPGPCTLLAGGKSGPAAAALANGALSHALDFEDTFDAAGLHPNAVAIPALLALAESADLRFGRLLDALALACDAACRIGMALPDDPAARGWYHPPMIAAAGAAVGAAWMLGLPQEAAIAAISLSLVQFSLTDALKRSPLSDLRCVRDGFAARAVVDGTLLAQGGVTGTIDPLGQDGLIGTLTGKAPLPATGPATGPNIGPSPAPFDLWGQHVTLKVWPSCRGTHPAIATALFLRDQGIAPDDIESVTFQVNPPDDMLFTPQADRQRPRNPIMAKFSIPFTFAHSFHHGAISLHSFSEAAIKDEQTLALSQKVSLESCSRDLAPSLRLTFNKGPGQKIEYHRLMPAPVHLAGERIPDEIRNKVEDCRAFATVESRQFIGRVLGADRNLKLAEFL